VPLQVLDRGQQEVGVVMELPDAGVAVHAEQAAHLVVPLVDVDVETTSVRWAVADPAAVPTLAQHERAVVLATDQLVMAPVARLAPGVLVTG
jgi:hypothetical protein